MITIRHANPSDSENLIHLTGLTPMRGKISLRIDRRPDFFLLLKERGDAIVLVAENQEHLIVGCFTACCRKFLVNHQEKNIYYLGDLKIHPDFTGTTLAFRLINKMREELIKIHAEIMFCVTANGNDLVLPFFKGKAGFPIFQRIGMFNIYQVLPKRKNKTSFKNPIHSERELKEFYNHFFERYTFSPKADDLKKLEHLVSKKNNKILAAISLFDSTPYKQNVVIGYPFWIGITLKFLHSIQRAFHLPSIPKKHQPLKILNVKYYAMADGCQQQLELLIEEARNIAYERKFHFLSIGTDSNDHLLNDIFKKFKAFIFKSNGWICFLKKDNDIYSKINSGIIHEDFSII